MSEANLTLVFDGPAVENGEIDVQELQATPDTTRSLVASQRFQCNFGNQLIYSR